MLALKLSFSVVFVCIEVKLGCKIPIIAITELTKTILDYVTMFFFTSSFVAGGDNIKYICFNLAKLLFKIGSTNFDIYFILVITKISKFLYNF